MIATGDGVSTTAITIANAPFFADVLDFVKYRAASRIDRTAGDELVLSSINSAIVEVNRQLEFKINEWLLLGYTTINAIPTAAHQPPEYFINAYRRAVYSLADALLVEHFRDFDSTAEGHQRADTMTDRVDIYRRESIYAVADLLGNPRRRIELL